MSKNKIRVVVSGAGGDVAQGTIKSLLSCALPIEIHPLNYDSNSAYMYMFPHGMISPEVSSPTYLDFLESYFVEKKIDVFIPTIDSEMELIANNVERLSQAARTHIFVNSRFSTLICQDKWSTYKYLVDNGFSSPRTWLGSSFSGQSEITFPVIVKPRKGSGSRDITIVHGESDLPRKCLDENHIVQEFLSEEMDELTCGVYTGVDHEVKGIAVFRRELKNGATVFAERILNSFIEDYVWRLASLLGTQYLNVQGKFDGKNFHIFELNGRLSGTTFMVSRVFNAPELFIRENVLGETVARASNPDLFIAMRTLEEFFISKSEYDQVILRINNR
jgi:carbamoyl-phosphate synthase large subunit